MQKTMNYKYDYIMRGGGGGGESPDKNYFECKKCMCVWGCENVVKRGNNKVIIKGISYAKSLY